VMSIHRMLVPIAIVFIAASSFADAPSTEPAGPTTQGTIDLLQGIQDKLQTVRTVQADFVETKLLALLNHKLMIRGHLALERPDRLIWIVRQPVRYAIRIEGDEVRQWDEDTNRVDVIHLGGDPTFKAVSDQMKSWFLGNYKALGDSYNVYINTRRPVSFQFQPKSQSMVAGMLKRIDLTFQEDTNYVDSMSVEESSGDTTTVQFVNARVNQPIGEKLWEMPPHEQ
jgi:outer membrane lipoprotein-sorting protein